METKVEIDDEQKYPNDSNIWSLIRATYFSKDALKRRLPVLLWLRVYQLNDFKYDLLAGLTVACTLIPQALGFALLANVPITHGLYSCIFPTFVYAIFGSCVDTALGPTALQAMFTGYYVSIGDVNNAALLSFISGILQIIIGFLSLDFIVDLVPFPVISAFSNAAVVTITVSQLPGFFGVPKSKNRSPNAFLTFYDFLKNFHKLRPFDTFLGCMCALFIFSVKFTADFAKNRKPCHRVENEATSGVKEKFTVMTETKFFRNLFVVLSLGRNLLTVIICSLIAFCFRDSQPFQLTTQIEPGLPAFEIPRFYANSSVTIGEKYESFLELLHTLTPGWIVMPFLASLTTIAVPKAISQSNQNASPKRICGNTFSIRNFDSSQEILTLGIANFLGSFIHAFPSAVSFNRAMIVHTSGVRTQLWNVITGIALLLAMSPIISPAFHYIPLTSLSAVVICAVVLLANPGDFIFIYNTNRIDFILYVVTFSLTLAGGLVPGILTGIFFFLISLLAKIVRPKIDCKLKHRVVEQESNQVCYSYLLVTPTQSIHFPSVDQLVSKSIEAIPNTFAAKSNDTKFVVVIDGQHIVHTDSTFLKGIKDFEISLRTRGIKIVFHNFHTQIRHKLYSLFRENVADFSHSETEDGLFEAIQNTYSTTA